MNNMASPAAAIFWPWHAWIDDVYENYLCICNQDDHDYTGPNEEWDDFDRTIDEIKNNENTYSAFRNLTTSGNVDIASNRTITFRAGTLIDLNPGFDIAAGANFYAYIDACPRYGDQTPRIASSSSSDLENDSPQVKDNNKNSFLIYPNPFISHIDVEYSFQNTNTVTFTIHNLFGQEVARLIDGEIKEAGKHIFSYDAGTLPAGIYFCSFIATSEHGDTFKEVRKQVKLK